MPVETSIIEQITPPPRPSAPAKLGKTPVNTGTLVFGLCGCNACLVGGLFNQSGLNNRKQSNTKNLETIAERHPREELFIVDDYILFIQINMQSVFRIRDILVRIRTRDLRIRILLFSSVTFKMPTKISFLLSTF
jgi:hypothetical protein